MRVGILGGTFDPIHIGHLIAASEAHTQLHLDIVTFLPAGQPWQKVESLQTPACARLDMVKLAIAGDTRFTASDMEIVREGPSYAIDTVQQWRAENPADELWWIMGADALATIESWHRWQEFVDAVHIVCVNRPGVPRVHTTCEVTHVSIPDVYISASELRSRVGQGVDNSYLIPESVISYIAEHELYRA